MKITNMSGIGTSTKITNDDGSEIGGVTAIDIRFRRNELVTATLTMNLALADIVITPAKNLIIVIDDKHYRLEELL